MIELKNISIQFDKEIMRDGHFIAHQGFVTGLMGISGSGKSSLLDIVSLLNYHGQFDYFLDGTNLKDLSQSQRALIQRTQIAYLRQKSVFLNTMNCLDNVRLESEISGHRISEKEALALLDKVHLKKKANVYPSKLSGGEEQRLAIAMALAKQADIIICDEITSMLDEENTNEIIQMLSDLAHHENKTVIIATHEQEVKHYIDQLYVIEDHTLKLVKETPSPDQANGGIKVTKTNKKYMWQVAFSQITKRKINYLLMMIITSLTVSFLWYSKAISDENKTFWADRLNSIAQNEFMIYYNPTEYDLPGHYGEYYLPFEDGISDQLLNIKELDAIYPFMGCGLLDLNSTVTKTTLSLYKDNTLILSKEITPETGSVGNMTSSFNALNSEIIFPWFDEQNLYDLCEVKTNNRNGMFISQDLAKELGLQTLEEGMTLNYDIFVPAAAFDYNAQSYSYNDANQTWVSYVQPCSIAKYEKIEVSMPISGILPEGYTDPIAIPGTLLIYIPHETMSSLFEEAKNMHEMKAIDYEYTPKAYRAFFSTDVDRQKLKSEIREIDDSIVVVDNYANKLAASNARKDQDNYLEGGTHFLLVLSIILMLVYGNYHKKDVMEDELFFKLRGISAHERKQQVLLELILMTLMISVFSIIISNLLLTHGFTVKYTLVFRQTLSSSYPFMIMANIGLAFLLALISELPLLLKK